jgi:hypothetical protein
MGPSGKCILAFHQTFQWLRSSAERRRHVQAMPLQDPARILDGSKALRKAVQATFDKAAPAQRVPGAQTPQRDGPPARAATSGVQAIMRQAHRSNVPTVRRLLQDLARRLDDDPPSAAEGVREGLEETLTVMGLGLFGAPAAVAYHHQCV